MLDPIKQEDISILVKNLSRITKDYFAFIKRNKELLEQFEDVTSAYEAHKATLQTVADEIEGEGKFYDDENIELYVKAGVVTVFPKALYKEKPINN